MGPSNDVLAAIMPVGVFLIHTERIVVALSHLSVYPNGCSLEVRESALGLDTFDIFERMMFIAQFGAETTAKLWDKTAPRWLPDGKPALMLTEHGYEAYGGSGRVHRTHKLWLAPLPPPEPGLLSVVSTDVGSGPYGCPLDGRAIAAASAEAKPYWR